MDNAALVFFKFTKSKILNITDFIDFSFIDIIDILLVALLLFTYINSWRNCSYKYFY